VPANYTHEGLHDVIQILMCDLRTVAFRQRGFHWKFSTRIRSASRSCPNTSSPGSPHAIPDGPSWETPRDHQLRARSPVGGPLAQQAGKLRRSDLRRQASTRPISGDRSGSPAAGTASSSPFGNPKIYTSSGDCRRRHHLAVNARWQPSPPAQAAGADLQGR
jgi:hypothetical protein